MRQYNDLKRVTLQQIFDAAKDAWKKLVFTKEDFYNDRSNPTCACFIGAAAIGLDTIASTVGAVLDEKGYILGEFVRINDLCETKEQVLDKVAERFGLVR